MSSYQNSNLDPKDPIDVSTTVTVQLRNWLTYLGRVDGLSVPQVVRQAIDNHIRARKATDAAFRDYTRRN